MNLSDLTPPRMGDRGRSLVYSVYIILISTFVFRISSLITCPTTSPLDIPDNPHPEFHDDDDFELPDHQALFPVFLAGL